MKTTLNKIKAKGACKTGWSKLLSYLNKRVADDTPIGLTEIMKSNGISDAVWALRTVDGYEKEKRTFAINCCRRVESIMKYPEYVYALDAAEQYVNGYISDGDVELIRHRLTAKGYTCEFFAIWYTLGTVSVYGNLPLEWFVIDELLESTQYGECKDHRSMLEEEFLRLCHACP